MDSGSCADMVGKETMKRELLSIADQLQHVATVVRPGRTFLRRLLDLSKTVSHPDHHVRQSAGARSDLAWWHLFLESWNGISLISTAHKGVPEFTFTSDASGAWGCGGYWDDKWFQLAWEDTVLILSERHSEGAHPNCFGSSCVGTGVAG